MATIEVKIGSLIVALSFGALSVPASAAPSPKQSPSPCSSAEYRQFDFWVGNWDITNALGGLAGGSDLALSNGQGALVHIVLVAHPREHDQDDESE